MLFNDGPIFLALAEAIRAGRWEAVAAHPYHPLYPAAIAAFQGLSGLGLEEAAVAVSIFGGVLTVVGIRLAIARLFDDAAGWLAGWVVAWHPWAVDFSSDVQSDGLYMGGFALGVAALAAVADRPTLRAALAAGVCAGLAYGVRPEGLGLLVAGGLLLGVGQRSAASPSPRRVAPGRERAGRGPIGPALAGLVGAALLVAPLVALDARVDGDWSLTRKKSLVGLAVGAPGGAGAAEVPSHSGPALPLPRSSERVDRATYAVPDRSVRGLLEAIGRVGRTSLAAFRYEVALFAVIGLYALRGRFDRRRDALPALLAVLYSGLLVLLVWGAGYVARRHALPALLPLVGYAVVGWRQVVGAALRRNPETDPPRPTVARPVFSAVALVVVLALVWGPRDLRVRRADRAPVRAAAEWLAAHAGPGAVVGAQKLRVAYYARGTHVPLPSGEGRAIDSVLREAGVEWVVIDEARLGDHRGLAEGLGDWLETIHVEQGAGRRVRVLAVR